jgi:hypothetical protein
VNEFGHCSSFRGGASVGGAEEGQTGARNSLEKDTGLVENRLRSDKVRTQRPWSTNKNAKKFVVEIFFALPPPPRPRQMHVCKLTQQKRLPSSLSLSLSSLCVAGRDCACVRKQGIGSEANSDDNKNFSDYQN